jgi:hypothetical protein
MTTRPAHRGSDGALPARRVKSPAPVANNCKHAAMHLASICCAFAASTRPLLDAHQMSPKSHP